MPPQGWKSVSIPNEVYEYFKKQWERNKMEYKIKEGITSFSGFVSKKLYDLMQREKQGTQG